MVADRSFDGMAHAAGYNAAARARRPVMEVPHAVLAGGGTVGGSDWEFPSMVSRTAGRTR